MNDNNNQIFEAIENPEHFSDDELLTLLEDEESNQIYIMMNKTADALAETPDLDMDKEWAIFSKKINCSTFSSSSKSFRTFFYRNVAAILIGVCVSIAVVAGSIGIRYSMTQNHADKELNISNNYPEARSTENHIVPSDSILDTVSNSPENSIIIFKNETLGEIIPRIADFYGTTILFRNETAKELHLYFQWDQLLSLNEIIDQLNNFQQINLRLSNETLIIE